MDFFVRMGRTGGDLRGEIVGERGGEGGVISVSFSRLSRCVV